MERPWRVSGGVEWRMCRPLKNICITRDGFYTKRNGKPLENVINDQT